ncbi:MAG: threonine-phosphate decarboxylase CobD [Alphaproteobacteria bacterium]|nr:threonine-phosphate decarboxylase CobD [Alphaproteobacteria bacterium]MBU2084279.1 threonine-phosphate decarboxylase CobD [Alphaproteobacteria bacterium]MBU2141417.1 threonine-phosphate decarboxylase CobD [Alphaproteobacteria bacterium]MBU2197355.1 threonine-phosphate decarboxylase CobD [Alphaproteobacteria bacterium]
MTDDLLHGGALDRMQIAYPNAPTPWIDLSTGINPWPYPVGVLPPSAWQHLPTAAAMQACRAAMAHAIGAPESAVLLAPGSELLIRLLPTIIAPRTVALASPTYGDHARAWRASGADVTEITDPLAEAGKVDALVLCNPNNPDGATLERSHLEYALTRQAARNGWLIVDEAYADISPALSLAPFAGAESLIILRSFGKFFGLAGLRLGALLGPPALLDAMSQRLGVWPVSGPALTIGTQAYGDGLWQAETRDRLAAARRRLDTILLDAGLWLVGGTDLFRLAKTDQAPQLWHRLAEAGIYVRRFGYAPDLLRIGLPANTAGEHRLAAALSP